MAAHPGQLITFLHAKRGTIMIMFIFSIKRLRLHLSSILSFPIKLESVTVRMDQPNGLNCFVLVNSESESCEFSQLLIRKFI